MTDTTGTNATSDTGQAGTSTDASTAFSNAAAALAAVATSLNETNNKLSTVTSSLGAVDAKLDSVSENVSKLAQGVSGQADTNTVDSARSIDNVYSVNAVESLKTSNARFVQDYAGEVLESSKRSRNWFDQAISNVQQHDQDVRAIITAGLRNSTETDNMVAKNAVEFNKAMDAQSIRHADTQLFQTSMGEGAEVETSTATANVALGAVVNDLLAAAESLKAVAASLATAPAAKTA